MLRQPWPAPCAPSDVALLAPSARLDPAAGGPALPPGMPLFRAERRLGDVARDAQGRQAPLESLFDESPAHALAGIARPEAFFDMLRARGARLVHTWALNDHQAIDHDFCSKLCSQIKREKVFLTEKDAVKLFPLLAATSAAAGEVSGSVLQAWAVPLEFKPEPGFFAAIDARLSSPHGP
jgi:tetraacyldisaccharide 4'-kinase